MGPVNENCGLQRRHGDRVSRWRRYEPAIQWVALVVIALALASLLLDSRDQAEQLRRAVQRLDARQNALCIAVKRGRIVFKNLVDQNGLRIGTRVTLIDCPSPVINPKGTK